MELVNEIDLENVSGGQDIKGTLAFAGIALAMTILFTAGSVILAKDIKETNRELKNYPPRRGLSFTISL